MPKARQILRIGYKTKKYEISLKDIETEKFELLLNRRKIRPQTVDGILHNLNSGKHFDSPFVVHKKNGRFQLIDGNHRYEAIAKFLDQHPKNRIEVTLNIYEGLTEQQLKDLYTAWNLGKKQSTNDVVKQYKDDISIFAMLERDFPCSITVYGGSNAVSFFKLVGAYLASQAPTFQGGFIGTPWDFVRKAQALVKQDVNNMKVFMKEFIEIFGPIKNNRFLRTTPFVALMRIWMDNRHIFSPYTRMRGYFRSRIRNDRIADDLAGMSGMKACRYVYEQYVRMLNKDRITNVFIKREELEEPEIEENSEE